MMRGILFFLIVFFEVTIEENVNIALRKNVSASSHMIDRPPGKAVDGDRTASHGSDVFHTLHSSALSWWSVDLGLELISPQVVIYFRSDYKTRRNGVRISLSSVEGSTTDFCEVVTGAADGSDIPDIYNITCEARGRYLNISTLTDNDDGGVILDFAEVEVYARTAAEVDIFEEYIPQCTGSVSFELEPVDIGLIVELEVIELNTRIECMQTCVALDLCIVFEYRNTTCKFWRAGSSGLSGTKIMWRKQ